MTLTPTELQLVGGGLVFATALGSFWFFKRRSDRAAANVNKTDEHSEQFDAIGEALTEDRIGRALVEKRRATDSKVAPGFEGSDRRVGSAQRREKQRVHPSRTRQGAIEEALSRDKIRLAEPRPPAKEVLERFGADPKPRLTPEQVSANRLRAQQEEELRRRRRQNDEDSNLAATMATIQSSNFDEGKAGWSMDKASDSDSFKSGGGSFGGAGASSSWGGDSSSSSCSSSSSDSGGSCSSSD